jgi:hypothetical protein
MKYSKSIFNKDLFDLQFEDIETFFKTEKEENLNLEFKSYVNKGEYSKKEEAIKKGVCAMLNSEGGIIIWGAPTEVKDSNGNTKANGDLTPFDSKLDKDRFINMLTSCIIPFPVGITVQVIKDQSGKSIFVIEIDKSIERPHQYDNRYYIRLDGQTRIAPHYLIKALMKSTDFPLLRGHIRLKKIESDGYNLILHFKRLLFNTSLYNNDKNVSTRMVIDPGNIIINHKNYGNFYDETYSLLSNGAPLMTNFILKISSAEIANDIDIVFQFAGEKSPSKMSTYKYRFSGILNIGDVKDENNYLIEKFENKMPADISNYSVDENIKLLLDN